MTVIQHRRGTTTNWAASSYVLEAGEIGVEIDNTDSTIVIGAKIGNGTDLWSGLEYIGAGLKNVVEDLTPQLGGDLDTNGFDITNINALTFDTTPVDVPVGTGVLSWNPVDKTLDLQSDGITYQLGQELAQNVMRFDSSGLTNGKVVYSVGSSGANLLVDYAIATSDTTSSNTLGVMTASASGGEKAPATTFGLVRNIDTSALTEGATVWLSGTVAGAMTTTKPAAPTHTVKIGICIRSHATEGVVFVNIQNGFELDEIHDVLIGTKVDNNLLAYDSDSGLWKNQTAAETGLAELSGATFSGVVVANGGITGATAKNMTVASSYSGSAFNGTKVVMVASQTGAADPTTRPDGTALQAGDIWIDW